MSEFREWGVRVSSGCRVSFTLIDLNGETGRRNGMASMTLRSPSLEAIVTPAETAGVEARGEGEAHRQTIEDFLGHLQDEFGLPPARVEITQALPAHCGFGSGTTTLVAIGRACAHLAGASVGSVDIARVARRAGTSGASVNLLDRGGFIVDGGHANPADFAEDPKRYLVPTRYAGAGKRPPVLISGQFPTWPVLLILGNGNKMHGEVERQFFHDTLPIPAEEARRTAHAVLMNLAPAILEADYPAFCRALNRITYETYFKQRQISMQSAQVQLLIEEARRTPAIDAINMSSEGPMCYAFTQNPRQAVDWLRELKQSGIVTDFWFSGARNHPLSIDFVPLGTDGACDVA